MATLKFYANKKAANCEILIGVNHLKQTRYINTQVRVAAYQWDAASCMVVNHPQAMQYNILLASQISSYNEKLLRHTIIGTKINTLSCTEVRDLLLDRPLQSHLFLPALQSYKDAALGDGTKRVYQGTYNIIRKYAADKADELTFEDITAKWLYNFDRWLSATMSTNSRAIQMRNIRAVFNRAIDEEIITCYPFRKFTIKHERTRHRALSIEQLRALMTMELPAPRDYYRDIFMLHFYLIGINTVDLLALKKIQANGRIEYRRAKTGRPYSIKVEPEALAIIQKYKGVEHLIDAGDKYATSQEFSHLIARRLKLIDGFEDVSVYWARHTWATIAAELDIPKETIAAALGHSSNSVTDIYIKFNPKKIDEANRKVIDYVTQKLQRL